MSLFRPFAAMGHGGVDSVNGQLQDEHAGFLTLFKGGVLLAGLC
jgi:hypothetical protein